MVDSGDSADTTSPRTSSITWAVFSPGGKRLADVSGTAVATDRCASLGPATVQGTALNAAVTTGQIDLAEAQQLPDGCRLGTLALYAGSFGLSYLDGCGEFRVEGTARTPKGDERTLSVTIDVLCFVSLEIDFGSIEWGSVAPGQLVKVDGDSTWLPPSGAPTVRNVGSSPSAVGVVLSPLSMTGPADGPGRRSVTEFGACAGLRPEAMHCASPITASVPTELLNESNEGLCPGASARLDVLFRAPSDLQPGRYAGSLKVVSRPIKIAGCGS